MGRHMFSTLGVFDSSHSTQPRRHLPIRTTCFIELSMSSNSMRSSAGTRDTVWVLQSNGHSAQQNLSPTLQLHHQPAPPSIPPPALSAAMIRKTVYWFFIFFRIFLFFLFFYFFQNFFIFFVFSAFFCFLFFSLCTASDVWRKTDVVVICVRSGDGLSCTPPALALLLVFLALLFAFGSHWQTWWNRCRQCLKCSMWSIL